MSDALQALVLSLLAGLAIPAGGLLAKVEHIQPQWLERPGSNRFVGHRDATLGKKVLDIAKAESEPMVQPDGVADDFGWEGVA